jgi:hypothetical protein
MKNTLIIGILLFASLTWGQSDDKSLSKIGRLNLGGHGLEFSFELPMSNTLVWENAIGIGSGSSYYSSAEYTFNFARPVPFLKSELKHIYNIKKRSSKDKNGSNNAGNYVGLQVKYSFGNSNDLDLNQTLLTEIHWGIQRPLGKRFIFNTHVGLGYLNDFDSNEGGISLTAGLRFGYKLF